MSIGVIIADDEELSRALLVALLDEVAADLPPLVLMAQCATGEEVVRAVREHQPDIVFLDINMPAGDGFSVVAALGDSGLASPPAIIFTTAHSRFAVQAFDVEAVDYLLKPISAEKVRRAIERVLKSRERDPDPVRIAVPTAKGTEYVTLAEIEYVEADSEYIVLQVGPRRHVVRGSLKTFARSLPAGFCQIHRSYIANRDHVARVEKTRTGGSELILVSGKAVPISRRYRSATMAWLESSSASRPPAARS